MRKARPPRATSVIRTARKKSAAEAAFTQLAWSTLSPTAREELFSNRGEEESVWAQRWQVNIPAMIDYARLLRAEVDKTPDEPLSTALSRGQVRIDHHVSTALLPAWHLELQRLDQLPVHWRVGLADKVAPDALADYRKKNRDTIADDKDLLAPVAFDPEHETIRQATQRFADHCLARRLRFKRYVGVTASLKPWPMFDEHVRWLVRYQVGGEEYPSIARTAGLGSAGQQRVKKAVTDLARLIGLTLRKRPRSQAQVSPTSDLRAAKQLRDELKQQFRVALKSGRLTCQAEIRAAIEELLPAWSLQQRKDLLLHMKISDPKPSHAAAYLSAAKFGLPVRQVRAGRAPKAQRQRLPSRMEAWTDQTERDLVKRKMRRR